VGKKERKTRTRGKEQEGKKWQAAGFGINEQWLVLFLQKTRNKPPKGLVFSSDR